MARNNRNKEKFDKRRGYDEDIQPSKGEDNRRTKDRAFKNPKCGGNHIEWYARNPQLLADSASFAYGWPAGNAIDLNSKYSNTTIPKYSVPGVMALRFVPTIGISRDRTSPINIAATNVYTFVRHANSGHANYDAPDLMMYLLAVDSGYMLHSFMRRIYGLCSLYSARNRYYPRAIIESMGVDFDDIIANLPNFRYLINRFAVQMGALCIPSDMSYHRRHMWLCDNIYADDPSSSKAQTYLFTPAGFYTYSNTSETGSKLEFNLELPSAGRQASNTVNDWKFADFVRACDAITSPIVSDEDINIMSGDILKAYGPDRVTKLVDTPADYAVLPIYDLGVLTQIQNATINGEVASVQDAAAFSALQGHTLTITQNPTVNEGAILSDPYFRARMGNTEASTFINTMALNKLVTMPSDTVTPEDNMRASRLTSMSTGVGANATKQKWLKYDSIPSEVVVSASIGYFMEVTSNEQKIWKLVFEDFFGTILTGTQLYFLNRISTFKMHPAIFVVKEDGTFEEFMEELNNYTIWKHQDVAKMHETALISEFDVPQAARAR